MTAGLFFCAKGWEKNIRKNFGNVSNSYCTMAKKVLY